MADKLSKETADQIEEAIDQFVKKYKTRMKGMVTFDHFILESTVDDFKKIIREKVN